MALELVAERPGDYFPDEVKRLGDRVLRAPELIPFLASLMQDTAQDDPPEVRDRVCREVIKLYPTVAESEARATAHDLSRVDGSADRESRSKIVEYLVFKAGPFSGFAARVSEYVCSVRDEGRRLVRPTQGVTVDAAFLGGGVIELHECKFNPANFLFERGNPPMLEGKARRKLDYLRDLHCILSSKYELVVHVHLTGFNFDVQRLNDVLRRHGYHNFRAAGPVDIAKAVNRAGRWRLIGGPALLLGG